VEDPASWLVTSAERGTAGAFNAVGDVTTLGDVLDACTRAADAAPRCTEAAHEWLAAADVEPWMGADSLPLWLPQPEYAGFVTRRNDAARAAGLVLRPLPATVSATLREEQEQGLHRDRRAGLVQLARAPCWSDSGPPDDDVPAVCRCRHVAMSTKRSVYSCGCSAWSAS
jgi:hypothetical protein